MKSRNWGRIIFISSESGVNIPVEMIHYGVTKTMQIAPASGLAATTAGTGVTVNSVLAGSTRVWRASSDSSRTSLPARASSASDVEKEFFQKVRPSSLLKRFARIDEVATMVTYSGQSIGVGHQWCGGAG